MNRPPEDFVLVSADALQDFALNCLLTAGLNEPHAEQLAELLVNSDARGVRSHGTRALGGYCRVVREGKANPNPNITVVAETDTTVHIDGDGSLGYAPTMVATEKCIEKAKDKGTAVGGVQCIGHYGSAGHYVRRAMAEGMIGFSVQSKSPQYYPNNEGRRAAQYGNPPLCFGLPSDEEPPVVLDVATCILADYQRGEEYEALEEMIPAAFFKSMGYTAVGTALGGAFVNQESERAKQVAEQWPFARMGGMVWLLDIGLFTPADTFRGAVDDMVRMAREQLIPIKGYDEATLPGAIEHKLEKQYRAEGIRFGEAEQERITELATEFGVERPF